MMAFSYKTMVLALVLSLSLAFSSAHPGQVICEHLKENECAFAVSSASRRCVLEKTEQDVYQCKTSDVSVDKISNHIETYACLGACGLERKTVGISSDAFLESSSMEKICSPGCSEHCPNIIDLYTNLASGEGASLSDLCKQSPNPHRKAAEVTSSGAALGPASSDGDAKGKPHRKMEEVLSPEAAPGPNAALEMHTLELHVEAPSPSPSA
ncbi:PAR1 protein [Rhynchospora pubera]|uniref:PAR1 protein n=1 Tax=Rhynchospora pubera TaxID=906938 RepID=A0AAV8AH36_9POAL|nr:PAR1 protein [Rhynchospora pubera]KAJ4788240.1 PAR1 protein [Rhynchospora pubera]